MNDREELERELAELEARNAAATSWGAAVGARHERIKAIRAALDADLPTAQDVRGILTRDHAQDESATTDAMWAAYEAFEFIRLKLVKHLDEPERSAFWKAVQARNAIGNCLVAQSKLGTAPRTPAASEGPFNTEMPSSLNDACRRLDLAQERISQLEAQVEDARKSLQIADRMVSDHIERFHDYDYRPEEQPPELASLHQIEHHLMGSLILDDDISSLTSTERQDG